MSASSSIGRTLPTILAGAELLVVGSLLGAMIVTGPVLPQILFYRLGLDPLTAARYMGVIFEQVTTLLCWLAGGSFILEGLRLMTGERPHWLTGSLRYLALGVTAAAVFLFALRYVPAIEAFHDRGPEALQSAAFYAIHETSRRIFSAGLLGAAVALVLVPTR